MTDESVNRRTVLLCDPVADEGDEQDALAPRSSTLQGRVIGLLDNTKPRVDTLLDEVRTRLGTDFPKAEFRYFRKESVSGAGAGLMEELANCDAVVTAVGD